MDKRPSEEQRNRFLAALRRHPPSALRRLRRDPDLYLQLALDAVERADIIDGSRIAAIFADLLRGRQSGDFAQRLFDAIPHGSQYLSGIAVKAGQMVAASIRIRSEETRAAKAAIWNDLAERCAQTGDASAGLRYAARAVRLFRRLVSENRDFHPKLIQALQVLAKRLSDTGDHERAISIAEEAVSRALDSARDVEGLRRYATALDTLANRLSRSGQHRRALIAATKAHAHLSEMDAAGAIQEEGLAASHLGLATIYTNLADYREALPHAQEAWLRLQVLALRNPSQFEAMYFLANDLVIGARSALGNPEADGPVPGDSLAFFQVRAAQDPKAFLHRYVCYLVRQSAILAEEIASDEAMELAIRACDGARRLHELFGDRFAMDEGHIHFHAAVLHRSRGEVQEARASALRALARFEVAGPEVAGAHNSISETKEFLASFQS